MKKTLKEAISESIEKFKNGAISVNNVECYVGDIQFLLTLTNTTNNNICKECGKTMSTKEEKDFGQCDKCCAWKYRDCSK